ncbi:hypothetical protein BJX70DRAFT_74778 [Aspergillus crustosus]
MQANAEKGRQFVNESQTAPNKATMIGMRLQDKAWGADMFRGRACASHGTKTTKDIDPESDPEMLVDDCSPEVRSPVIKTTVPQAECWMAQRPRQSLSLFYSSSSSLPRSFINVLSLTTSITRRTAGELADESSFHQFILPTEFVSISGSSSLESSLILQASRGAPQKQAISRVSALGQPLAMPLDATVPLFQVAISKVSSRFRRCHCGSPKALTLSPAQPNMPRRGMDHLRYSLCSCLRPIPAL